MSEEINELDVLKARAKQMGITFHPNIGLEKLKLKVNKSIEGSSEPEPEEKVEEPKSQVKVAPRQRGPSVGLETKAQKNARLRREATRLVRVNVTCMNQNKKSWQGEMFSVGNSSIGMVKKFVMFNTPDGYYVPQIILKQIQARKFQTFVKSRDAHNNELNNGKLVPEFSVQIMTPLTSVELAELAQRQAMSGSLA